MSTPIISVDRLRKELEAGRLHKRSRVTSHWQPNDDAYNGKVPVYAKLPYNFHIPILSGFEDTLIAKLDEAPSLRYGSSQTGETRLSRQMTGLWETQSDRPDMDYAMADLQSKRHAARYGRGFLKTLGSKKPFGIDVLSIDPYDMVTEPNGGGELEDHRFCIQDGIFRDKEQLLEGVESGMYDKAAVTRLLAGPTASMEAYKTESDSTTRFSSLNQAGFGYEYAGSKVYHLCEHVTVCEGKRYLVTWSPESGITLAKKTLKERYGCDLLPWTSWAPYHDSKVFWSKAPDDDVRQAAEATRVTIMEMLVNVQRQNWGTKVYDPERFSAADLVMAAPNGLIPSKPGAAGLPGGLSGSYQIVQTPSVSIAVNALEFLDRFVGQKTGVTPDTQGASAEDKVGIYFGNLEQVSDRMGLQSRYYRNAWRRVGTRFLYQAKRNLSGKMAVRVIGAAGAETEYLMARNIDPTLGVTVMGGSAEATVSQAKRKERSAAIDRVMANQTTAPLMNLPMALSESLKAGGFDDDEVGLLLNKNAGTTYRDQQLRAQERVEKILEGETPPLYQGATTVFVDSVLKSAQSFTDGDGPEHERLIAYAQAHIPIAAKNAAIEAAREASMNTLSAMRGPQGETEAAPGQEDVPENDNPNPNEPVQQLPGADEGAPL